MHAQLLIFRPLVLKSVLIAFAATLLLATSAHAYLGGFEPADGYTLGAISNGSAPSSQYGDVTYYNAGQNGANAGGGVPTAIAPDSGLWDLLTQPGAYFRTAAVRASYTSTAPPYGPFPSGSGNDVPAYIVGNHSPGYLSPSALALRNETPNSGGPIGGPMEYDYKLDTFDFGGQVPASITGGVVTTAFRFCPNPSDPPGGPLRDKFIMSFVDGGGTIGAQIGYAGDNSVYWRVGSSGPWTYPGIIADATNWDQFSVSIDLTTDKFTVNYHQIVPNITTTIVPAGTPLVPMGNLTNLRWFLTDQVLGGTGGKNFFDNFQFSVPNVPEPGTCFLVISGLAGLAVGVRRRVEAPSNRNRSQD